MKERGASKQSGDQDRDFRGPHVTGMEVRKIVPELCKSKAKEDEETNDIIPSELRPELKPLPTPPPMDDPITAGFKALLAESFKTGKLTVAMGAARHIPDEVLCECYSACVRNWEYPK